MDARDVLRLVLLGLAYFALAKLALAVASLHPSASPVWPPSGLALAACLLWGNRVWPAIAAGALLTNATTFGSLATSLAIALGNTLEAVVTAALIARWCTREETFETPLRVARFAALTLAPGTTISATVGVGSLVVTGYAEAAQFAPIWLTWWLGDVGGQVLVAPVLVLWARSDLARLGRERRRERALLLATTIAVGLVAFSPLLAQTTLRAALAFLAIIPMLWAALRHGQRETATAALLLSLFAIWGALEDDGPFARTSLNESFLLVLTFVIGTTVPSLVLSADVAVRRQSEERYRGLVEHANDIVATFDRDLRFTSANPAAQRLLGYAPGELMGTPLSRYVPPEQLSLVRALLERRPGGEAATRSEMQFTARDERQVSLEANSRLLFNADGQPVGVHTVARDVSERKAEEARQKLFERELQHRIKNLLAVVQSIVGNTLARSADAQSARRAVEGRLKALARAHEFVVPNSDAGVPIRDLVEAELSTFAARATIDGAALAIDDAFAQKLALVVHELATNAAKYGALSTPDGRVLVAWKVEPAEPEPCLEFSWVERGGPPAEPPRREGFGMKLIAVLLGHTHRVSFAPGGLSFAFAVPFSQVAARTAG